MRVLCSSLSRSVISSKSHQIQNGLSKEITIRMSMSIEYNVSIKNVIILLCGLLDGLDASSIIILQKSSNSNSNRRQKNSLLNVFFSFSNDTSRGT